MTNPTPSPFEISRQIGQNFAPVIERQKDIGAIDNIFAQVAEKGNEADFDGLMQQIITRVSPQNQAAALNILQGKKTQHLEKIAKESYKGLGKTLKELNPNNEYYNTLGSIYESDIPTSEMSKVAKAISEGTQFRQKQQDRLNKDQVLKVYNNKIKEIDNDIKNTRSYETDIINDLQSKKSRLQKERDFAVGLEYLYDDKKPEEIDETETLEVFNFGNPKHLERFVELENKYKGNKKELDKALKKEFNFDKFK